MSAVSLFRLWLTATVLLVTCQDRFCIEVLSDMDVSVKVPQAAERIRNEPESVWVEFIQLAADNKPLNLGQGFPDFAAPKYLIDSLHEATEASAGANQSEVKQAILSNQYTRSFGHPRLIKALVDYYREFRSFDRLRDAQRQVLVTVGAYEALFASIMAFVNPGDQVLIIDPAFDAYAPIVAMAQGESVYVALRPSKDVGGSAGGPISSSLFTLDFEEMRQKITNKTRMLILNTPNNPLGKMYSRQELETMASLCKEHNLLVLADEVYEQMHFAHSGGSEHLSMALIDGMWERTISVGSAGKTFSVTGWKIGWALGAEHLIRYVQLVHQTAIYTVATPLQEALARAFEHEMELLRKGSQQAYWPQLRRDLEVKRSRMASILERAGIVPIVPQGGYFMLADFSSFLQRPWPSVQPQQQQGLSNSSRQANSLQTNHNAPTNLYKHQIQMEPNLPAKANTNDFKLARWLSRTKKLQGIPGSAFYSAPNKHLAENLIRFCFIKQTSTLDELENLIRELTAETGRARARL